MNHDTITTAGAGAAIISPVWLPYIQEVSHLAGLVLPVLGVVWLLTQIVSLIYRTYTKEDTPHER